MCVVNLNVSLQPCSHRWYKLVRSCSNASNLANCPGKLKLEGWETKNHDCPFCSPSTSSRSDIDNSTHKLFGGQGPTTRRRQSDSTVGSNSPSRGRTNSVSISLTSTNASRSSSQDSDTEAKELDRAERNRMMNRRLEAYMFMNPGKGLNNRQEDDLPTVPEVSPDPIDRPGLSRNASMLGKGWKRGVKMSRGMFKA